LSTAEAAGLADAPFRGIFTVLGAEEVRGIVMFRLM
jgi:hypothetical protein